MPPGAAWVWEPEPAWVVAWAAADAELLHQGTESHTNGIKERQFPANAAPSFVRGRASLATLG